MTLIKKYICDRCGKEETNLDKVERKWEQLVNREGFDYIHYCESCQKVKNKILNKEGFIR